MVDETALKTMHRDEESDQFRWEKHDTKWGKASQKQNKNPQSFLKITHMQNKVPPSQKLQGHAYMQQNPFALKEDNP